MLIEYETNKFVKENHKIEIQDTTNIFLHGKNLCDGSNTYFGIWTVKEYVLIITLRSHRNTIYKYFAKEINPENYIKEYLESNKHVDVISRYLFQKQLQKITSILEI